MRSCLGKDRQSVPGAGKHETCVKRGKLTIDNQRGKNPTTNNQCQERKKITVPAKCTEPVPSARNVPSAPLLSAGKLTIAVQARK